MYVSPRRRLRIVASEYVEEEGAHCIGNSRCTWSGGLAEWMGRHGGPVVCARGCTVSGLSPEPQPPAIKEWLSCPCFPLAVPYPCPD